MRAWRAPQPGRESGRRVVWLGLFGTLALAAVDLLLSGRLTMFFDLGFITLCLGLGRLPGKEASYVVAFAPPLVLTLAFAALGLIDAGAVGHADDGTFAAVIAGLTGHAAALGIGYALCLGGLGARVTSRDVSPDPRPSRAALGGVRGKAEEGADAEHRRLTTTQSRRTPGAVQQATGLGDTP